MTHVRSLSFVFVLVAACALVACGTVRPPVIESPCAGLICAAFAVPPLGKRILLCADDMVTLQTQIDMLPRGAVPVPLTAAEKQAARH